MNDIIGTIGKVTTPIVTLCRLLIQVLLALLIFATIASMSGFDVPYLKSLTVGDLTGKAAMIAALAFYLRG